MSVSKESLKKKKGGGLKLPLNTDPCSAVSESKYHINRSSDLTLDQSLEATSLCKQGR